MTKNRSILILGFLSAITPFVGFPPTWEDTLALVYGLVIVLLAFLIALEHRKKIVEIRRTEEEVMRVSNGESVVSDYKVEEIFIPTENKVESM